jgi:hypothetical protein
LTGSKRISANAISALKEALASVFWFKRDLSRYLQTAVRDPRWLAGIDWENQYKRDSIHQFVDRLVADETRHRDLLIRLISDVAAMDDFPGGDFATTSSPTRRNSSRRSRTKRGSRR